MTYNIDFLIAAMVILLLVLWYFLGQKRAEDLNNQVFLFFAIIGILDVVAELASNYYISFPNSNCEIATMLATTIFYLLQALLPFTVICYIQTLHDNKIISAKKMFLSGVPTFILMGMILTNPFTEKLFYFDIPAGYMKGPWYMLMYYSALCHMAEKTGLSKSEESAGNPVDIRCGSGDPAFISSASYNRVWYESGNSGTIYYDQQSSCKYRYTYRII
ncbi:hypothetical protein [Coprococcus comes]|uniref:hypothetical protein n=1 Tax=Coprococcus comes TaxID=410072 RepID=UPI0034A4457C